MKRRRFKRTDKIKPAWAQPPNTYITPQGEMYGDIAEYAHARKKEREIEEEMREEVYGCLHYWLLMKRLNKAVELRLKMFDRLPPGVRHEFMSSR